MPITQSRMIELLEEHESNLAAIRDERTRIRAVIQSGLSDADKIAMVIAELQASGPLFDTAARIERRHFIANEQRNNNKRAKAEAKRRAAGVPELGSPTYVSAQRKATNDALLDRMYDDAMRGQTITPESLSSCSAPTQYDDSGK